MIVSQGTHAPVLIRIVGIILIRAVILSIPIPCVTGSGIFRVIAVPNELGTRKRRSCTLVLISAQERAKYHSTKRSLGFAIPAALDGPCSSPIAMKWSGFTLH